MRHGEFQGHHCWNCWNVALWIGNDEGLYRLAADVAVRRGMKGAVAVLFRTLGGMRTPDGARYTFAGIKRAVSGLELVGAPRATSFTRDANRFQSTRSRSAAISSRPASEGEGSL